MKVAQAGKNVLILDDQVEVMDALPAKTFMITFSPMSGFGLKQTEDFVTDPNIHLFGNRESMVEMSLKAFMGQTGSTGVMLSGTKGSGKTLFARQLATEFNRRGMAVVLVNSEAANQGLKDYISSLPDNVMFLFDEYEKSFDDDLQEDMLPLFDGIANKHHLYVITMNDLDRSSNYIIARPGRFLLHYQFAGLKKSEIKEYLEAEAPNTAEGDLQKVYALASTMNVTYDILSAVAYMLNLGYTVNEFFDSLNIQDSNMASQYFKFSVDYNGETWVGYDYVDVTDTAEENRVYMQPQQGTVGNTAELRLFVKNYNVDDMGNLTGDITRVILNDGAKDPSVDEVSNLVLTLVNRSRKAV